MKNGGFLPEIKYNIHIICDNIYHVLSVCMFMYIYICGFSDGSVLKNPPVMDRRAWWATIHGVTKNQTWLSMQACIYIYNVLVSKFLMQTVLYMSNFWFFLLSFFFNKEKQSFLLLKWFNGIKNLTSCSYKDSEMPKEFQYFQRLKRSKNESYSRHYTITWQF